MTVDSEWAWLNNRVSRALLEEFPRAYRVDLAKLVHGADLEMKTEDGRLGLRARGGAGPLVYAEPLHGEGGTLRADALAILSRGSLDQPTDVQQWLGMDLGHLLDTGGLEVSAHNMLQLQLWANADFLPVLQGHIESGKRLFRVGAHRTLYARVRVLEIITELCNGVPVDKLRIGPRLKYSTLVSGIWQIYPGAVMCFPMTARHQPLALVYMAPLGSQIVMLPPKGTVFKRPLQLFTWPVGTTGQALQGPGIGIYLQAEKLWEGEGAQEILASCVGGTDRLLDWITDPGQWRDAHGYFQGDELWLAWTSLTQGMSALMALGQTWNGSSALWDAFRALGILQGVWVGSQEGSVKLADLLHPDRLRNFAAANITDSRLRDWSIRVIGNWESKLNEGFPGRSMDEAVRVVADVRNIVHGVGATGQNRARRLAVLREMAENEASLQLIADIAVMWWSAAMLSPANAYRAGRAPWTVGQGERQVGN